MSITEVRTEVLPDEVYDEQCTRMINYTAELNKIILSHQKNFNKEIWLLLGSTRVGKTTIAAKLHSELAKEEFYDKMVKSDSITDILDVGGFLISGGNKSVTVVPHISVLNNTVIIDLAGFLETDKLNAPILTLLNYSLFPYLKKCKLMIVLELNSLISAASLNSTLSCYHTELQKILTKEHFGIGMGSSGYLLTKSDKHNSKIKEKWLASLEYKVDPNEVPLSSCVRDLARSYSSENVSFLGEDRQTAASALGKNFVILNYKDHNSSEFFKSLSDLASKLPSFDLSNKTFNLELHTNSLSRTVAEKMIILLRETTELTENMKKISVEYILEMRKIQQSFRANRDIMDQNDELIKTKTITSATLKASNEFIQFDQPRLKKQIELKINEIKEYKSHLEGYLEKTGLVPTLSITALSCHKSSGKYKMYCHVNKHKNNQSNIGVLFMANEEYKQRYDEIYECNNMSQLYSLNLVAIPLSHKTQGSDLIGLNVSQDNDITCLIFEETLISAHSLLKSIIEDHTNRIQSSQSELENLENQLKANSIKFKSQEEEITKTGYLIVKANDDNKIKHKENITLVANCNLTKIQTSDRITQMLEKMKDLHNNQRVLRTQSICDILIKAKIGNVVFTDSNRKIKISQVEFEQIIKDLKQLIMESDIN